MSGKSSSVRKKLSGPQYDFMTSRWVGCVHVLTPMQTVQIPNVHIHKQSYGERRMKLSQSNETS